MFFFYFFPRAWTALITFLWFQMLIVPSLLLKRFPRIYRPKCSLPFPLFVFKSLSCCFRSLIDIVNLDVTTYNAGGYHGDLNETFCVGNVDADGRRLVQTAFECLSAALAMVRPGTLYRDLGTVIERTAKANQCSVVRTYCGHGIGSLFHTIPNVPHYAKNKAKGTMKEGEYDI